ncbi:hypothetical protein [Geodermatophilus marinus]|uniref:hypothetical protein n=1 Tax=Geodermatophilus sp. LHW52908 TaxID=2303986 RepID=UPI000E3D7D02|nr:hypothetical protein [Geodermatophilus sp. LHW52908]RFU18976.1 hypothetical protein D0Z06_23815 [Geodermatophilus sp. LHW52908]
MGAGAAVLTAAAVLVGPGAAAAPSDPVGRAVSAAEEAAEAAQEAADQARRAAQDAADAAQGAARDATAAAEDAAGDAAAAAEDGAEDAAGDAAADGDTGHLDWVPEDLRQDLQDLQDVPADQRADEVERVLGDARDGEYGDRAEMWAQRWSDVLDRLPQDLRADLQGVLAAEPEQARAELRGIWERALDGGYGSTVQMWARWLGENAGQWDVGGTAQDPMG